MLKHTHKTAWTLPSWYLYVTDQDYQINIVVGGWQPNHPQNGKCFKCFFFLNQIMIFSIIGMWALAMEHSLTCGKKESIKAWCLFICLFKNFFQELEKPQDQHLSYIFAEQGLRSVPSFHAKRVTVCWCCGKNTSQWYSSRKGTALKKNSTAL